MASRGAAVTDIPAVVLEATEPAYKSLGDICCVEGCDNPRRPAGNGRSRFCYRCHHLFYTANDPKKMKRKREVESVRRHRLKEK